MSSSDAYKSSGPSSGASSASFVSAGSGRDSDERTDLSLDYERVDSYRVEADYLFKLLLVGNSGVGKSALVARFAERSYSPIFISTIGVDFKICTLKVNTPGGGEKIVKLQIWDTAGQDRFRSITQSYYRGAHGVLMVYDTTEEASLHDIHKTWIPECKRFARPDTQLVLVGNKSDLDTDSRFARWSEEEQTTAMCAEEGQMPRYRTSCKTDDGVDEAILGLVERLMANRGLLASATTSKKCKPSVDLGSSNKSVPTSSSSLFNCCRMS